MGFSFGKINVKTSKKSAKQELISNILLAEESNPEHPFVLVLLDNLYYPDKVRKIKLFLKKNGIFNYKAVVCTYNKISEKDDIEDGLVKFYRANKSDWDKYLPEDDETPRRILAAGASLYSITQSSDLMTHYFYDIVFNSPKFWSPDHKAWVYPIDSFNDIFLPPPKTSPRYGAQYIIGAPTDTYKMQFALYQFKNILSDKNQEFPWDYGIEPEIIVATSEEHATKIMKSLMGSELLAADLETSGLDYIKNRIGCVTLANSIDKGYYLPWEFVNKRVLATLLASVKKLIGANFKFDAKFLRKNGIRQIYIHEDTVQLGHVLNEIRSNSLKTHAWQYTSMGGYDRELDEYKDKTKVDSYLDIEEDILITYATKDPVVTLRSYFAMQTQLDWIDSTYPNEKVPEWTMRRYYEEKMMPAYNTFIDIEYWGMYVEKNRLKKARKDLLSEMEELQDGLAAVWGVPASFDFNSAQKLGELFEKIGFEDLGRNKAGKYLTNDGVLKRWVQLGHPEIKQLQRLRSLKTILKTFVSKIEGDSKGWEQYLRDHEDGSVRIHPSFSVMRAESGRGRCSNPNFQNIPARGDFAKKVKGVVTTPNKEDYVLCTMDFASLQVRLATTDSFFNPRGRDRTLWELYTDPSKGADLHSVTGYSVFAKDKVFDLEEIEVEDDKGNKKIFLGHEIVNTKRGEIFASELTPEDELLEFL
jgi:DNA polymerase I-like protein with 3'-5' exonuclease and polymerase domains